MFMSGLRYCIRLHRAEAPQTSQYAAFDEKVVAYSGFRSRRIALPGGIRYRSSSKIIKVNFDRYSHMVP